MDTNKNTTESEDTMKVFWVPAKQVPLSIKKLLVTADRVSGGIRDIIETFQVNRFCSKNPKLIWMYREGLERK